MKTYYFLVLIFFIVTLATSGQSKTDWEKWDFLIGKWAGEGNGQPGPGSGAFTFAFDLDKNILVRKNHTEFPASNVRPAFTHDDLLVVYPETGGEPSKAIYFDNEGHVIHYSVVYEGESIVFTSDKQGNLPVFRLSYIPLDNTTVNVKFEMSQDGEKFMTYLEGKSRKEK
jgi:hypothetical protein